MLTLSQKSEIYTRVDHFVAIANEEYHRELEGPHVRFDKRGSCGGTADSNLNELNFNAKLMLENWDEYINQIIPHEVAHLVKNAVYGTSRKGAMMRSHGGYWAYIMRVFGVNPDRTHDMDVGNVAQPKRKFLYECPCCKTEFILSSVKHNKLVRGTKRYSHNTCGETIVLVKELGTVTMEEAINQKTPAFIKQAVAKKAPKAPKAGTKIAHALSVYNAMEVDGVRCSRQDIISAMANSMFITKHAAAGYYQNCKKRIG